MKTDKKELEEFVVANIPSEKKYYVNLLGQIKGPHGKILGGNAKQSNSKERVIFRDIEGKQRSMAYLKIVWLTFNPNEEYGKSDIFVLKDHKAKLLMHPSNIVKVSKQEVAEKLTQARILSTERQQIINFIKKKKKASKEDLFVLLQLENRKNGRKVLSNLLTKMLKEKTIIRDSLAVYKLPN